MARTVSTFDEFLDKHVTRVSQFEDEINAIVNLDNSMREAAKKPTLRAVRRRRSKSADARIMWSVMQKSDSMVCECLDDLEDLQDLEDLRLLHEMNRAFLVDESQGKGYSSSDSGVCDLLTDSLCDMSLEEKASSTPKKTSRRKGLKRRSSDSYKDEEMEIWYASTPKSVRKMNLDHEELEDENWYWR